MLWSIAVTLAVIVAWFAALVTGRVPSALHRFLAAYVRYATHVIAFVYVIGRKFPGFTGRAGWFYGIDIVIPGPDRQSRWKTLFRFFLAIPRCCSQAHSAVWRSSLRSSVGGTRW